MDPQARYDEIADDLAHRHAEVELSQMMGMPCVKANGKMVAGLWKGAMAFKLPDTEQRERALGLEGATLFDPSEKGRPFKEWVQVPAEHADRWPELADQAITITPPAG